MNKVIFILICVFLFYSCKKKEEDNNPDIYDIQGRRVHTLIDQKLTGGDHQIRWDGSNYSNLKVSSGVYIYQLVLNHEVADKKQLLYLK